MGLNKTLFCSRLVCKGEKEACFIVRLCDSVSLTQLDNYSRYQVLVNWTSPPLRAIYSNRIISSDFCQHSTITVLLYYTQHISLLSLHSFSHSTHISLHWRVRENLQKFTVAELMTNEMLWWPGSSPVVLLGGKIGRNWWRCPHSSLYRSSPLLYLQQHHTSQSPQSPAHPADN